MAEQTRSAVVTYAGGRHGPWKKDYLVSEQLSTVRSEAMTHFGVADSSDGVNQVVFRLYRVAGGSGVRTSVSDSA